jgi:hypothetical protein
VRFLSSVSLSVLLQDVEYVFVYQHLVVMSRSERAQTGLNDARSVGVSIDICRPYNSYRLMGVPSLPFCVFVAKNIPNPKLVCPYAIANSQINPIFVRPGGISSFLIFESSSVGRPHLSTILIGIMAYTWHVCARLEDAGLTRRSETSRLLLFRSVERTGRGEDRFPSRPSRTRASDYLDWPRLR